MAEENKTKTLQQELREAQEMIKMLKENTDNLKAEIAANKTTSPNILMFILFIVAIMVLTLAKTDFLDKVDDFRKELLEN